jgi:hypothetical protein
VRSLWTALFLTLCCLAAPGSTQAGGIAPDLARQIQANPLSMKPVRVIVRLRRHQLPRQ